MMRCAAFCIWILVLNCRTNAQITAAGQGGKLALWLATGMTQEVGKKVTIAIYGGGGMHSDPSGAGRYDPLRHVGTFSFRQSTTINLGRVFIVGAFGYWRRNLYSTSAPFELLPFPLSFRNEVRNYYKIGYTLKAGKVVYTIAARTEFRFFYDQTFRSRLPASFEFRTRALVSFKVPLNKLKNNRLIATNEVFFAADQYNDAAKNPDTKQEWTRYRFTDNRLSIYFQHSFAHEKFAMDLGVMALYTRNGIYQNNFVFSNILMADLVIYNPFSRINKGISTKQLPELPHS